MQYFIPVCINTHTNIYACVSLAKFSLHLKHYSLHQEIFDDGKAMRMEDCWIEVPLFAHELGISVGTVPHVSRNKLFMFEVSNH
jgi:hypothetical protein